MFAIGSCVSRIWDLAYAKSINGRRPHGVKWIPAFAYRYFAERPVASSTLGGNRTFKTTVTPQRPSPFVGRNTFEAPGMPLSICG